MLTTSASRTLSRASASRIALAARPAAVRPGRAYATVPPAGEPVNPPKPGAQPGPSPPAPAGTNPLVIVGGAAALAGLGVYFFTRPQDAKQQLGQAEAKARQGADHVGEAVDSLKAAGQEKVEDLKSEANKRARDLEAEAERLKKAGDRKWQEVKAQAERAYEDARRETQSLGNKAISDAKTVLHQAESKGDEVKAKAEVEGKKKGWFS